MKLLSKILCLLALPNFLFCTNHGVVAILEGEPSANISRSVNALSGDYYINSAIEVKGHEPIEIHRFYASGLHEKSKKGWQWIAHLKLKKKQNEIFVHTPSGAGGLFIKKKDHWRLNSFDGITNTASPEISGRHDLANQRLLSIDSGYVLIHPDKTKSYYTRKHGSDYLLTKEVRPSSALCLYSYDKEDRICEIRTTDQEQSCTYAYVKVSYPKNKIHIRTSDGKEITYLLDGKKLTRITTNYGYEEAFTYTKGKITRRDLPNDRHVAIRYINKDKSTTEGHETNLQTHRDERYGRVHTLYTPSHSDGALHPLHRFLYDYKERQYRNTSHVYDPYGYRTTFDYTNTYRPLNVISCDLDGVHRLEERFDWHGHRLSKKSYLLDGKPYWQRQLQYDHHGNVLQETISGQNLQPATTFYEYNEDNLLTYKESPSGLIETYDYIPGTHLLKEKTRRDHTGVKQHFSYAYHGSVLIEEKEETNLYTTIKRITPWKQEPAVGLPHIIEKSSPERHLETRKIFYDDFANPIREEVYDSTHQLRYTLTSAFDKAGRKISETNPLGQEATYTYDGMGKLICETTFAGVPIIYTYDAADHLIKKQTAERVETFSYDAKGRLLTKTDHRGNNTHYTYDGFDHVSSIEYPDGSTHFYTRDPTGNILSKTDGRNQTTHYIYNGRGDVISITHPDGTQTCKAYDVSGYCISETDEEGITTHYTYDAFGNMTGKRIEDLLYEEWEYDAETLQTFRDNAGVKTHYTYDLSGRRVAEERDGILQTYTYDSLGREASHTCGSRVTTTEYDLLDRPVAKEIPNVWREDYAYDDAGNLHCTTKYVHNQPCKWITHFDIYDRPIKQITPLGRTTYIAYHDTKNPTVERTDPSGQTTIETFDPMDRLIRKEIVETDFLEEYRYDPNGNLTHQRCLDKNVQFIYDSRDRCVETHDEGRITRYTYNRRGEEVVKTQPDGRKILSSYDALGRRINIQTEELNDTLVYDAHGNLIQFSGITRSYDTRGNIRAESNGIQKTHDSFNRPLTITYPDGTTSYYTYDARNLTSITYQDKVIHYTYDLAGNILTANGTSYAYDKEGRPLNLHSPTITQEKLTYNAKGNLISYLENGKEYNLTYDSLDQITEEKGHTYTHDALYRRQSKDHHYQKNSYDANGCIAGYTYDTLNRLTKNRQYDILDRLVKLNNDDILYDGNEDIGTVRKGQIINLRVGPLIKINGEIYHTQTDLFQNLRHLGSNQIDYTAFGEHTPNLECPWGYKGMRYDSDTNLYRCGRRDYSPQTGCFLTPDPLDYIDSLNLYQYCFNNPYRYQDPTGESTSAALLAFGVKWGSAAGLSTNPFGWIILGGLVTGAGLAYGCHLYNQYDLRQQRIEAYQLDKDEGYIDDAYSRKREYETTDRKQPGDPGGPPKELDGRELGTDPAVKPGEGWEWKGSGAPSSGRGTWISEDRSRGAHPDLNHPPGKDPHWDTYKGQGRNKEEWRSYLDGTWEKKN